MCKIPKFEIELETKGYMEHLRNTHKGAKVKIKRGYTGKVYFNEKTDLGRMFVYLDNGKKGDYILCYEKDLEFIDYFN